MSKLSGLLENSDVQWLFMGEIMNVVRGASPRPISKYITHETDGVNWIKIGDVSPTSKYITSTKEKITKEGASKSRYLKRGDFVLSNSMSFGRPYILKVDGCIHDGWIALSNFEDTLLPDYLYYVLRSNEVQTFFAKSVGTGAVSNLNADIVRRTLIPVPTLEVQKEIVRILDNMESLILKLKEELGERKRQFEYYREELLIEKGIPNYSLEELCEPVRGRIDVCELDESNYVGVDNLLPNKSGKVLATSIPENGVCIRYEKNDILVGNIRPYLKKIWFADNGGGTNGDVLVYRIKKVYKDKVMPMYLYYILSSDDFFNYDNRYAKGGKMPRGDKRKNLEYSLYIPDSKSEQARIVSILDNMVALQDKLQAEIDMREMQFEYYREQLMTF